MNQRVLPGPGAGFEREKAVSLKSSSFMMENLLKPDKERREPECPDPMEPPSKIKALTVAAHLAG